MEDRPYAVVGNEARVEAWSAVRLPFEPKGWLRDFQQELQQCLRNMKATTSSVLYGEYAAPAPAFVDLENVLLYNVGSGCYSHLARNGIVCRRAVSDDGRHHMTYVCTEPTAAIMPDGPVIARAQLASMPPGSSPAHWWAALRERIVLSTTDSLIGEFGVLAEAGSAWRRGLAPAVKSLLDGLVATLHVHDGSHQDHVTAALNDVGDGEPLWQLLNNDELAILGERRLVRPHGQKIAWNPADELCSSFALVRVAGTGALAVTIVAL
jgi:hypothetical protein